MEKNTQHGMDTRAHIGGLYGNFTGNLRYHKMDEGENVQFPYCVQFKH